MFRYLLVLAMAFLCICHNVLASIDSLSTNATAWESVLDEVVVTGNFAPQSMKQSVYQVRQISAQRIQSQGVTQLQQLLQTELNIRFAQDLALGEATLSLQGLSGQNVKVLLDGVPVIGRQGTTNAVDLNQIDVNSIERIEIVEGPMAVSYGPDAIAGVINIITRRPVQKQLSARARIHTESAGSEYGLNEGIHNQSVGAGYRWKNFYTQADVSRNFFGGWQGNAEGRDRQWHPKKQWLANALVGYEKNDFNLCYRIDGMKERIDNRENFQGNEAIDQEYHIERINHQLQAEARFSDRIQYNGAISYTHFLRQTRSILVNRDTEQRFLAPGKGRQDVNQFDGITIRQTVHIRVADNLSLQSGIDVNVESGEGGRIAEGRRNISDYAAFLSAEYQPHRSVKLRPGLRSTYNSAYPAPPVIPAFNSLINLNPSMRLRASYAMGFRSPSIRELYFSFFDASHSILGNPDLTAEQSHSFNTSLQKDLWSSGPVKAGLELSAFYNRVRNMIGFGQSAADPRITTYLNIDQFETRGMNVLANFASGRFDGRLGFSYIGRYNMILGSSDVVEDLTYSPEMNASLSYLFEKPAITVNFFYKYTGVMPFYELDAMQNPRLAQIGDFHWADLSLQKKIMDHLQFSLGIRNVFNVTEIENTSLAAGAHSAGGPRPVGYGRSFFAGLQFNLSK
ncbi:MAG: TonB-dependent receptor [Cyclobacteriaceae bacterium]|nr:TonB-dependent receptor [Cyclobacteriaceae bacterium]